MAINRTTDLKRILDDHIWSHWPILLQVQSREHKVSIIPYRHSLILRKHAVSAGQASGLVRYVGTESLV